MSPHYFGLVLDLLSGVLWWTSLVKVLTLSARMQNMCEVPDLISKPVDFCPPPMVYCHQSLVDETQRVPVVGRWSLVLCCRAACEESL